MKSFFIVWILLLAASLLGGCVGSSGECEEAIAIESVYPNNSSAREPVLIKGTGFSSKTIVRFGNEKANINELNSTYISTNVPSDISGLTKLSVSNGDNCLTSVDFEVLSNRSSNVHSSPPIYFIPPAGMSFPITIRLNATIEMRNFYDPRHTLRIGCCFNPQSERFNGEESYSGSMGDSYTIRYEGIQEIGMNRIIINLDRPEPYLDDELVGGFYTINQIINGQARVNNYFIAFSVISGRQYVFIDKP